MVTTSSCRQQRRVTTIRHPESTEGRRDRPGGMVISKRGIRPLWKMTNHHDKTMVTNPSGRAASAVATEMVTQVPTRWPARVTRWAKTIRQMVTEPRPGYPTAVTRKETRHAHAGPLDHLVRCVDRLAYPSRAFWLFGFVSLLLDLDHLPRFIAIAFPRLQWQTPPARFLHWPAVLLTWYACIAMGTLCMGLLAFKLGEHIGERMVTPHVVDDVTAVSSSHHPTPEVHQ